MEFSPSGNVLAIAVKHWEFEKYDKQHLKVYFFNRNLKDGQYELTKSQTIRPTDKLVDDKAANLSSQREKAAFKRYISCMNFGKDEKSFGLVVRNGPNECLVFVYDLYLGKKMNFRKFNVVIEKI